jgi:hypothetical protein
VTQHYDQGERMGYPREQHFFSSANQPARQQKMPYYWEPSEVAEFTSSHRATASHDAFSLERALLLEANKEAIRLIEEQEKCLFVLN